MRPAATIADLVAHAALRDGAATALVSPRHRLSYAALDAAIDHAAAGLRTLELAPGDRVAIALDHGAEAVVAIFAAIRADMIVVPVNPKLKPAQIAHILEDCTPRLLLTSALRGEQIARHASASGTRVIVCGGGHEDIREAFALAPAGPCPPCSRLEQDPAMILYTSGSTGLPKGVTVSHRNLLAGAESVNAYLGTSPEDVVLSLLPLSFDAGFSQATTAFLAGARLVMHGMLRAEDAARVAEAEGVTMITGVPPLWHLLADVAWTPSARDRLRLFANTGGHMPRPLLDRLRALFPSARPFLMYGLTEAFRSTYLDPAEVDRRPDSIGRPIPGNDIAVLREDGGACAPGEIGELVHRGPLVTLGYWNNPEETARRFKPLPRPGGTGLLPEMAVFSGDLVERDADGFLIFRGRRDEMIKTSGYRVSPGEIEAALGDAPNLREVAAFGIEDPRLGQRIVAAAVFGPDGDGVVAAGQHCRQRLAPYMIPEIWPVSSLPRSPNGKIDRTGLKLAYAARDTETRLAGEAAS